jgi:hypothetical protein
MLSPLKQWSPNYLLNDWTFSKPDYGHLIFNMAMAPFNGLFSIETLSWIGRFSYWSMVIIALFRLGKNFRIPTWMITLSIFLWVLYGQSIVGGEYIVGPFQAKSLAFVFLLFALDGFIRQADRLASIFLGLCFSFHPSVGTWGGLAIGLTLLILRYPAKKLARTIFFAALFALPGLIALIPYVLESKSFSWEQWKYFVLTLQSHHLDPSSWALRDILLVYILFAFNWFCFRQNKDDFTQRFLIAFQFFLCLVFSLGIVLRYTENYELLKLYPFRLFPIFIPLFFFLNVMKVYHYSSIRPAAGIVVLGFLALLSFGNPLGAIVDTSKVNYMFWTQKEDDLRKGFKWLGENTANGSIVISPPWRRDSWYISKRAQIACLRCFPIDRLEEYRERIECLVGKIETYPENVRVQMMESFYNQLNKEEIESIRQKYGGDYLVSKGNYTYPLVFDSGTYKVYLLKAAISWKPSSLGQ